MALWIVGLVSGPVSGPIKGRSNLLSPGRAAGGSKAGEAVLVSWGFVHATGRPAQPSRSAACSRRDGVRERSTIYP